MTNNVMKRTKIHKYYSEVHQSELTIIGTNHNVDWKTVYQELVNHSPQIICYEQGVVGGGFDPEAGAEHKAIKEYVDEYNVEKRGVDVESLRKVDAGVVEDLDPGDDGFVERSTELTKDEKYISSSGYHSTAAEARGTDDLSELSIKDLDEANAKAAAENPRKHMFFMKLRDQRMALELNKALTQYRKVVLIAGASHMPGVLRNLEWEENR